MELDPVERDFVRAVMDTIEQCRRLGYNPGYFRQMIEKDGAVAACRRLLQAPTDRPSEGFTRLWEMGRLDLTVEHLIGYRPEFAGLFTEDEQRLARERLTLFGFKG